jgi:nicotinate-nucleotide pyrophosphorylase (carboxylating)
MIKPQSFSEFFQGPARDFLFRTVDLALDEDGPDLTSQAVFHQDDRLQARLLAKEDTMVVGLPMIEVILSRLHPDLSAWQVDYLVPEASAVVSGTVVAEIAGPAQTILKAERVLLNFICHLSGVAEITREFLDRLQGSTTRLLDTRKTLPGLRYTEKYAVQAAGGLNHRLNLSDMLMLKDNHIDRGGGIAPAVERLRRCYDPCPPIEVECRTLEEVDQAVSCAVQRIMLDNMDPAGIREALQRIPSGLETEISGGVSLESVAELGRLGADFISVGCITNSARNADLSLKVLQESG